MNDIENKRVLVVGAGSGIGRAVFDGFRSRGANVGALELDPAKCERLSADGSGPVVCGDAANREVNEAAVTQLVDAYGGLDVLINCVGLFDYYLGLGDIDPDVFDEAFSEAMNINVRTHLLSVRASLDLLRASRGSIVLTCSTSSFTAGRGGVLYIASKFALRGCVAALANELAPEIRVNGVAPGGTVGTDLRGLRSLGLQDRSLGDAPEREDSVRARSPLDVALSATDHVASYLFLASDASRGMTGRFLHPDGGSNLG